MQKSEMITKEIVPNGLQGKPNKVPAVRVEAYSESALPEGLTSLGRNKLTYLLKGVGQAKASDRILELFGGTSAFTAIIKKLINPRQFLSIDLHYSLSSRAPWRYDVKENYRRHVGSNGKNKLPFFISADAAQLPFKDGSIDLILAPDSPRSSEERIGDKMTAGIESTLSFQDQQKLFLGTSLEAWRILTENGRFVGTAPLSWAEQLNTIGYRTIQLLSDIDIPNVTKVNIGHSLRFKSRGVADPIVYFRCVK